MVNTLTHKAKKIIMNEDDVLKDIKQGNITQLILNKSAILFCKEAEKKIMTSEL
jgi:hypothetical protein